jgi:thiamine pyrophosphokinase
VRALVVGAAPRSGSETFYSALAREHEVVVAADAAGEWLLDLGLTPDLVVGDFDSSGPDAIERLAAAHVPMRRYPSAKDATDLELAVAAAREFGVTGLTLTAAFSCRLDHTLAALGVLARGADLHATLREPDLTGWALSGGVHGHLELPLERDSLVSVVAVLGAAYGVTVRGMRYRLSDADLAPLAGLGVSNVVVELPASVTVESGSLVVLAPDGPNP